MKPSQVLDGHSFTYTGSSWGRLLGVLIDAKCMNPVIFFDELDKLSPPGWSADPSRL